MLRISKWPSAVGRIRVYFSQQKDFLKKVGKGLKEAKHWQNYQNPFSLEIILETNHALKTFRCLEYKSLQENGKNN